MSLKMKSNPKCPTNVKDVTPEWLQEVMTTALNDDVEVIHLNAVSDNAGLLSSTFKAQIKTTAANTTVNLFIKIGFELGKDNHLDEFVGKTNIDRLEVKAYREDLGHLINFEQQNHGASKIADIIPKVYCCDINANPDDRGLYIIMEDLSNEYGPVEKSKGTSFQGLKVILESIATFHAVSYCYGQIKNVIFAANQPKHPTVGFLSLNDRVRNVDGFFEMVKEDFRGHEIGQDLLPLFEKLSKHWQTAMTRVFEDETENRFLSHGDLWVNNVMLRKDEKACKIFDWQFLCPKGPYLDFVRAVAYGAHPSNIDKWWDHLIDAYVDTMVATCTSFNVQSPFNRQEFEKNVLTRGFFPNFCMTFAEYEINCRRSKMTMDQFIWVAAMAVKHSPELF